jgi:hypothetical protein
MGAYFLRLEVDFSQTRGEESTVVDQQEDAATFKPGKVRAG